jgi:NAD(P)-dependent dehydrogenase (short-subunit alcohol dehydrogenase family)
MAPATPVDFESARGTARPADPALLYDWLRKRGLEYGEAFQRIDQLWIGEGEALGRIDPWHGAVAMQGGTLHLTSLDASLHLLGACLWTASPAVGNLDPYVPVAVERFTMYPAGAPRWARAVAGSRSAPPADSLTGEVQIFDAAGGLRARLEGVTCRRVPREAMLDAAGRDPLEYLYQVEWRDEPVSGTAASPSPGRWLIFTDARQIGESIGGLVRSRGGKASLVSRGDSYARRTDGRFVLNPGIDDHYRRLIRDVSTDLGGPSDHIVHLWGIDAGQSDALTDGALESAAVTTVLHLVQALAGSRASARLCLVTRGVRSPKPSLSALAQTPLWGIARTLGIEHPELKPLVVDLDVDGRPEEQVRALVDEVLAGDRDTQIALARSRRLVPRLVPRSRATPSASPGRVLPDASYLITGGLGGLGLIVAEWLVAQGARHLVLVARRGPSADAEVVLAKVRAEGVEPLIVGADVANTSEVATLFDRIRESMPPLRGVVHAAGVLDPALLIRMTDEQMAAVLRPKVQGAWNIHARTVQLPLDFFVLYSSLAAVIGEAGQANYAAANAFLDGLARYRRAIGLPAISINWGPWADTGMAAGLDARYRASWSAWGLGSITSRTGVRILEDALSSDLPQLVVLPLDRGRTRESEVAARRGLVARAPHDAVLDFVLGPSRMPARARDAAEYIIGRLQAAAPAERSALMRDFLRAEVAAVLGMRAEDLQIDAPLNTLGLDSLMGLQLKDRIAASLNLVLSMLSLVRGPSVIDLAEELIALLPTGDSDRGVVMGRPRGDERALLEQIDDLPEDEIDALLAQFSAESDGIDGRLGKENS